ncbi:hypothetical protein [Nonomuraea rhodomycinica]|uniref:SprT-like family protein n=1 Tax=Nonomuraea rhodomycinica TaxID=1712872 RepID=A0A7Y6IZN4_9ACTN|nr:hypothetical protein [Nonomuraea rhodomycinica]NUW47016.1 hypothetical protein [Nonomuraea rhodomycinica]
MTDHGSKIIAALEKAWTDIQSRHPEVPDVVMITGTSGQRGGDRWGHHWPERWVLADGSGRRPELFIAGELFAKGGRRTLLTLLHEAAHALAHARRIKDTSREGRYHNRRFVEVARELGLTPPDKPDTGIGFSAVTLEDATAATYAATIEAMDAAALAYLVDLNELLTSVVVTGTGPGAGIDLGEEGGEVAPVSLPGTVTTKRRRSGRRVPAECGCTPPRRIQLTPKALEDGPLICGLCSKRFQAPELDDQDAGEDPEPDEEG